MNKADNVVGGIGKPRFVLCGDNYIENGEFEVNLTGWITVNGASQQQYATNDTDYGRYVNYISTAAGVSSGVMTEIDYGSSLSGKSWAISYAIAGDTNQIFVGIEVEGILYTTVEAVTITNTQQYFLSKVILPQSVSGTCGHLQIRANPNHSFSLDHVSARLITYDLTLENPTGEFLQRWTKEIRSEYELIDGRHVEYLTGWRFYTVLTYEYINKADEITRINISEADHILFFPHQDEQFFVDAIWNKEYERRYAAKVFIGHIGKVPLLGLEVVKRIPKI